MRPQGIADYWLAVIVLKQKVLQFISPTNYKATVYRRHTAIIKAATKCGAHHNQEGYMCKNKIQLAIGRGFKVQ